MSQKFTIFYCWQSDTTQSHGRYFIREALERAAENIGSDVPYKILIESDTENAAGLCNIPETILRRIREADAVVSDMTFVAKTEGEDPKFCSNPNVLFELGYAFRSLGPERLICVMNEKHGAASNQIFDLAHHRHPVCYESPRKDATRKQIIESLAKELNTPLRLVLALGPSSPHGGLDSKYHDEHRIQIEHHWRGSAAGSRTEGKCTTAFGFRPARFAKRWADIDALRNVVSKQCIQSPSGYKAHPTLDHDVPVDWGLYNDRFEEPWSLTYSGQFWAEINMNFESRSEITLTEVDAMVSPEAPEGNVVPVGVWVDAEMRLRYLAAEFAFAANLASTFADSEMIEWAIESKNISGNWLKVSDWTTMGPCRSPILTRSGTCTAKEFTENWSQYFFAVAGDFCDLFSRDGRKIDVDFFKKCAKPYLKVS